MEITYLPLFPDNKCFWYLMKYFVKLFFTVSDKIIAAQNKKPSFQVNKYARRNSLNQEILLIREKCFYNCFFVPCSILKQKFE